MKRLTPILFSLILALLFLFTNPAYGQNNKIKIVTGDLPPYSYMDKGEHVGVATEIVQEMINRVGYSGNMLVRPWARAILKSEGDNRLTFPLARLPYRENKYNWVGPILQDRLVFAMRASDKRTFKSINDLKNLRVGVIKGAPTLARLQKLGFNNLDVTTLETSIARKLLLKRVEAWFSTELMIHFILRELNTDLSKVRIAYADLNISMYVAASKNLESKIDVWQKALDGMKSDGVYNDILMRNNIEVE